MTFHRQLGEELVFWDNKWMKDGSLNRGERKVIFQWREELQASRRQVALEINDWDLLGIKLANEGELIG